MSTAPIISILHPTARVKPYPSFPRGWRAACEQFFAACAHPENVEYVLIVHESRWDEFLRDGLPVEFGLKFGFMRAAVINGTVESVSFPMSYWGAVKIVVNRGRDCVVDQINAGAAAASGSLFIGIMDDLEAPARWDEKLLDLLPAPYEAGEYPAVSAVRVPEVAKQLENEWVIDLTGEPTDWIVYSAMTRKRYERYGYVLHPAFESMYADNYYSEIAHRDGVVISGRHVGFKHNHPSNGRSEMDEVYALQNRQEAYLYGFITYQRLIHGSRLLSVCLPGENFPFAVSDSHMMLSNHLHQGNRFVVSLHRGHSSNVYVTRIGLTKQVLGMQAQADLVLWIDDDNQLTPEQFEMLLADLDQDPELDIVTGWCWCDNDGEPDEHGNPKAWMISCGRQGYDLSVAKFKQEDVLQSVKSGKFLISSADLVPDYFWSGFPVVLMRGDALRRLGWRAFKPILNDQVQNEFTSEDTSFFYNARELGMKCAVDLRVKVPHLKLRAIEPAFIPESQKVQALEARGVLSPELLEVGA